MVGKDREADLQEDGEKIHQTRMKQKQQTILKNGNWSIMSYRHCPFAIVSAPNNYKPRSSF